MQSLKIKKSNKFQTYGIIINEKKQIINELANLGFKLRPYVRQTGCGWRSPWLLKNRKILDYLLVFIPQGKGIFKIGDQEFPVESGDLIIHDYWLHSKNKK